MLVCLRSEKGERSPREATKERGDNQSSEVSRPFRNGIYAKREGGF